MFEFITNPEERGQVGIGTLIVFIAMVLVAAIAAGVLINTAGFLQSQAEATGQESTDLVSERIEVGSSVGIVASGADTLKEIRVSVSGAPGSDNIDLTETTIQAVGPDGQENLVFVPGGTLDTSYGNVSGNETDAQAEVDVGANTLTANVSIGTSGNNDEYNLTVTDGSNTDYTTINDSSFSSPDTVNVALTNLSGNMASGDELTVTLKAPDGSDLDTDTVAVVDLVSGVNDLSGSQFAIRDDGDLQRSAVLDSESQFQILLNPDAGAFNADGTAFSEGEQATLDIVSPAGATTQVELRAPDLFNSVDEAVRL
ncbi:flagellin FlaB [Halorubrum cibi]|uniref:Flagellin n=1 Tax=Halorubrum cibi TaxID=413815 RepID=A0A521C904_9EURY|nr:archaellin/type IV pilin N-terminal domain-containing protein [Halorubrum cibi]SMO55873.1 flagellin FlaB [Halorubrum cibi]